jgi:hypothetical protein
VCQFEFSRLDACSPRLGLVAMFWDVREYAMNSDTENLVSEILAKSGAVAKCQTCGNYMIFAR